MMSKTRKIAPLLAFASCSLLLSGCGAGPSPSTLAPVTPLHIALQGSVHGGQQPISGAAITLYAGSTSSYGNSVTNILTTAVATT